MRQRKDLLWFLPMGIFFLFSLFFFSLTGYRFSGLVCLGIAGVIFIYYLFWRFPKPAFRILRRILTILLVIGLCFAIFTGILIGRAANGDGEDCDYIILLGAAVHGTTPSLSLRERMDAAYDYLTTHPDTICIVSGGQGSGENITEAACMFSYLTGKGIDPSRIWQEDKATSTEENLQFSLSLIESITGIRPKTIGIVSSEYHLYRASLMARAQDIIPVCIPATTTWISLRINYFLREIVAVWYYTLLGG